MWDILFYIFFLNLFFALWTFTFYQFLIFFKKKFSGITYLLFNFFFFFLISFPLFFLFSLFLKLLDIRFIESNDCLTYISTEQEEKMKEIRENFGDILRLLNKDIQEINRKIKKIETHLIIPAEKPEKPDENRGDLSKNKKKSPKPSLEKKNTKDDKIGLRRSRSASTTSTKSNKIRNDSKGKGKPEEKEDTEDRKRKSLDFGYESVGSVE